jgi:methionyl-tRNA formyltransferase
MRLAFAGTPDFAATALRALLAAGFPVALVMAQPDRPAGRGMKPSVGPVKQVALECGLPIAQPATLREPASWTALAESRADVLVVAAYGLLLPPAVLALPSRGCVNIHASLLPRWRGAAPIQRALLAGDDRTGVCIMQMDAGLDTGPVLLERAIPIRPDDTGGTLHDRLAALGAEAIVEALRQVEAGSAVARPQPAEGVTYAAKIKPEEASLDFASPAEVLARAVRAFDPWPVARARLRGESLRIWAARPSDRATGQPPGTVVAAGPEGIELACGAGSLVVTELQRPGRGRLHAADFLRGWPVACGERFGS